MIEIYVFWWEIDRGRQTCFIHHLGIFTRRKNLALGAAAAASQALVLPRMRGTATATFFLATTLVGLALGPYTAGYVSAQNSDNLSIGVLSTLWIAPIGLVVLVAAIRLTPKASATVIERAEAAGEQISQD